MSRIYFHSPGGDAEVLGAERAHLGALVNDISEQHLRNYGHRHLEPLRELTGDSYLEPDKPHFLGSFITAFRVRRDKLLTWRGHEIEAFAMALNTAIELGGEKMRLIARLEGQCEIHCYVEGENRAWLAGLIEDGLAAGLLRQGMGWEGPPDTRHGKGPGVIPLLRSRDDEAVVTSYSVERSFPYAAFVSMPPPPEDWRPDDWTEREWADLDDEARDDYRDERRSEDFDNLPSEDRWARGMAWLRERSQTMMLELRPDVWGTIQFGHGLTLSDLEETDWRTRIEQALGLVDA